MTTKKIKSLNSSNAAQVVRKILFRARLIVANPSNWKYLNALDLTPVQNGVIVLTHESNRLGASMLAENIAKEAKNQGSCIYILTRQFGELNQEYAQTAPLRIVFSKIKMKSVLKKLHTAGYNRLLANTVVNGDCIRIAKECGYTVVSLIHEMPKVIQQLQAESSLKELEKYSDCVVFPTKGMQKKITGQFCVTPNSWEIKPQGIYLQDVDSNTLNKTTRDILGKLNKSEKIKIAVGVGNTTEIKGFDYFLKMARKAPTDILFVWAGKKESFYDICLSKGSVPTNFVYLGKLTTAAEMAALYTIADVLAMTSRVDTFPSAVLEAMKFGTPVIGFAESGGVSEVVQNGVNGTLIDKMGDTDAFLQAIISIVQNTSQYMSLSKNAKKTALNYSFENYVRFLMALFDEKSEV
ncbi:glycosyltransferase [Faecalibacterium tardum]|uniref:Glycosyltransferase n=1 Tax=Faecalibacterium tardum TaxID=3133156 RepID=A0ABV1AYZ4_9FIRM